MNHLIVHPGWGVAYGDQHLIAERLSLYQSAYQDYCQRYVTAEDTVIVFFPFLDNSDKATILAEDLPLYLQGKLARGGRVNPQILTLLLQHLYAQMTGKSLTKLMPKQANQQLLVWLKQQMAHSEALIAQLVDLSRQQPLFYGCLLNHPEVLQVAGMLNDALQATGANLAYMNCGILSMAHEKVQELFGRMTGQVSVQIIGDWYNECVYSIVLQLNEIASKKTDLEIFTKALPEFCAFNEHQKAFQKHLIHSNNRDRFLFVDVSPSRTK